jgi:hypothetical protein
MRHHVFLWLVVANRATAWAFHPISHPHGACPMPRRFLWFLVLLSGACGLCRCTMLPAPPQPTTAQPYALIVLPRALHLRGLDAQTFDARMSMQEIRVTPGPHRLRLTYEGSSPQHRGQQDVIFLLEIHAGHHYGLEPKTCGIFWRPAVAEHTLIAGYCTTHTCTDAERSVPPRIPRTPKCNTD